MFSPKCDIYFIFLTPRLRDHCVSRGIKIRRLEMMDNNIEMFSGNKGAGSHVRSQ